MKNVSKAQAARRVAGIVVIAALCVTVLLVTGCQEPDEGGGGGGGNKQTPIAADFDFDNLTQTLGSVTAVTITPKEGKSPGEITIYYDGSTTLPSAVGTYAVTFNVAAEADWNAANELSAGTLIIKLGVEMVYVPGGSFEMGKNLGTGGGSDITPIRTVTLSGFYIGKYPITQKQFQAVTGRNPSGFSSNPAAGEVQENRPVEGPVNWYVVIDFCNVLSIKEGLIPYYIIDKENKDPNNDNVNDSYKWMVTFNNAANGYRLPTEAQWEYAAKGGNGTPGNYTYSGSDVLDEVAWYSDNSGGMTHEVGKKAPNGLGLYDMNGNVREWCWDWNGRYPSEDQTDPVGPSIGWYRVIRGGGWGNSAAYTTTIYRQALYPSGGGSNVGFRLARPPEGN